MKDERMLMKDQTRHNVFSNGKNKNIMSIIKKSRKKLKITILLKNTKKPINNKIYYSESNK